MEIQVIEEKNNPLLNRREVKFRIIHDDVTPSRKSVVDRLAATMNSKRGMVIVDNIKTEFGKLESVGYAKIYESEERARQVERTHITERNTFEKAEAKPEAS